MSNQPLLFLIVGSNEPLYEAEIHRRGSTGTSDAVARQSYFVVHSSLDLVESAAWLTQNMYLKVVDKVNQQYVSTFLTAGNIKFVLLHGGRSEDSIKNFFYEVYELYVKLSMNPFYHVDTAITSKEFDRRVKTVARRYLA
ncbi:Sedlin [Nitzschia inconspicua]|uniref:Sedlin n=1 Tax=Nitzschia inconspicua TaxID=303405 RepID=A0A9K3K444_9STRA|nr:hypothetical protein IV203_020425 [Nitzschia inconspicua]KAG7358301.1 Sedlin [Nitzschia inconspicua]